MKGAAQQHIIQPDLDIKNKVLVDKRKAMIKVLKDKRPNANLTEQRYHSFRKQPTNYT